MKLFAKTALTLLSITIFQNVIAQNNHLNLPPLSKDQPSYLPQDYQKAEKEQIRSFQEKNQEISSIDLLALDSTVTFYGDPAVGQNPRAKMVYEYDYEGRMTKRTSYQKYIGQTNWDLNHEIIQIYRSNPFELEIIELFMYPNNNWDTASLKLYQMDEFGRDTAITQYNRDSNTSNLKRSSKKTYQYNSNDDVTQFRQYSADAIGNIYLASEVDYIYNGLFQMIERNFKRGLPGSLSVVNFLRNEYSYNGLGKLVTEKIYEWDVNDAVYYSTYKIDRFYSFSGKYIGYKNYARPFNGSNTDSLILSTDFSIQFDSTGGKSLEHTKNYNGPNGNLYYEQKTIYTNNSAGKPESKLILETRSNFPQLDSLWTTFYEYNSAGLVVREKLVQKTVNSWIDIDRFFYTYDSKGRQTSYEKQWFNPSTNQWQNMEYFTYAFDVLDQYITYTNYIPDGSSYTPTRIQSWDTDVNYLRTDIVVANYPYKSKVNSILREFPAEPNSNYIQRFYWSSQSFTSVEPILESNFNLYPNPAIDYVQIEFDGDQGQLILYDISGRLIKNQFVTSNETVNISDLKSGVYLYTITINGKTLNGKFVKK